VLEAQVNRHQVHLAVGVSDGSAVAACPVTMLKGLEARSEAPVALQALIERLDPDIIHIHNVVNPLVLESLEGRPVVMTIQDHRAFCPGRGKWTLEGQVCTTPMCREACRACFDDATYFEHIYALTQRRLASIRPFRLTVLSHFMKAELVAVGLPADRIAVIPPFVYDLDLEASPDGPPCVLFSGRLVAAKGVEEAITAWQRSGIPLPMVVAGTGSDRTRLERLYPQCELPGWVPHHRLASIYRRAKLLIMPGRWQEPFGIVGLEAMTFGVPVVAWDSGGIRDWHPGEGLVPWGDLEGLARAAAAQVGRTVAPPSGFDRESLMARLEAVYHAALER